MTFASDLYFSTRDAIKSRVSDLQRAGSYAERLIDTITTGWQIDEDRSLGDSIDDDCGSWADALSRPDVAEYVADIPAATRPLALDLALSGWETAADIRIQAALAAQHRRLALVPDLDDGEDYLRAMGWQAEAQERARA